MPASPIRPRWLAAAAVLATALASTALCSPAIAAAADGDVGVMGSVGKVTYPASMTLTAAQALEQARRTGQKVTAGSATTATDLVTANPDGTLTMTRTLEPARKRVGGQWKDLDATLIRNPDGTLSPAVSTTAVVLSGGGTGPLARLSGGGSGFELGVPTSLLAPTLSGDTATYTAVLPGVDLQVRATKLGGFSEVFIVRDAAAAANPALDQLVLSARTTGLTLSNDAAGNIVGKDTAGRAVLSATSPLMWDSTTGVAAAGTSQPESSPTATQSTTQGPGSGANIASLRATVTPNAITLNPAALLDSAATQYPVYIDPAFQWTPVSPAFTGWATVAGLPASYADNNYWKNTPDPDGRLQVGYSPPGENGVQIKARSLLNFSVPLATLKGATINSAVIDMTNVWSFNCTPSTINLYAPATDLTQGNATWNGWSGVPLGSAVQSKSFAHGHDSGCPALGEPFDVTSTIRADVTANNSLRTFVLKAGDESTTTGWKKFDRSSVKMTVQYNHLPNVPTALRTSPTTSCGASPASPVGLGPVSLYAPVSDPDGNTVGVEFKLWKTSNTAQTALASSNPGVLTAGNNTTAVLNVAQSVLETAAAGATTDFSWKVRVTDFPASATDTTHYSAWSTECKLKFDPTRMGTPSITVDPGAQVGQPATVHIAKNPSDTSPPSGYLIQVNGGAPINVAADASGNATAQITPTRFTNIVAATSLSSGGNPGGAGSAIFNATPAATAQPDDFNGDDIADLLTPGSTNGLPAGLWLAPGGNSGQINPVGTNIGVYGTGATGIRTPTAYTGAQVLTGMFTGSNLQDVLLYYPNGDAGGQNRGGGSIVSGNGDGSPLQPDSGSQQAITGETLCEINDATGACFTGSEPQQLIAANDAIGFGDPFPDLLGVVQNPVGSYHLNYYSSGGRGYFQPAARLGRTTPTGGIDWDKWTLATALTSSGTDMYLWNRTTGALYLWHNLAYTDDLTFQTQYTIATGWHTGSTDTLRAADIDRDGDADLWTIGAGGVVTAHLVSGLDTTPTITAQPTQTLVTGNHAWLLNDSTSGNVGGNAATDTVGTLHASGASAGTAATTDGAVWDTGDLFSPALALNRPEATTKTGYLTTSGTPVATNTDFTLSLWAKPVTGGTVLSQDGNTAAAFKLWAEPTDKSWRFAMSRTDVASPVWDTAAAAAGSAGWGVWSQITVTYNATTGTIIVYLNGVNAASASHTTKWTPSPATLPMRIGAHRNGTGTATAGYFGGKVAFVQTWNRMWKYPTPNNHDFDNDGRNDVITAGTDGKLWLYPHRGSGLNTFGTPVQIGTNWDTMRWNVTDWDANGVPDVMAVDTTGKLWWYPTINGVPNYPLRQQVGYGWTTVTHASGNADSNPHADDFGIWSSTGELYWYPNGCCRVRIGTGGWNGYRIYPADFNNDGADDIVAIDPTGNLWLYPNTRQSGTSLLGTRTQIGWGWTAYKIAMIDMDDDGRKDIFAIDASNNAWVYPATGNWAGGSRYQVASGWSTSVAAVIG